MKSDCGALFLLAIGLLQMTGDITDLALLKGIGAATAASPAPKVFSAVRGLETYSSRFVLECEDAESERSALSVDLTPQMYAKLRGPYNRRNVFGAVLAYGPVLANDPRARPMFEAVSRYALCGSRPLLEELDVWPGRSCRSIRVRVLPREGSDTGDLPLELTPPCH